MSRAPLIATSALIGAAVGAVAMMLVPSARVAGLEDRIADLEEERAAARRDANDWELVASSERDRRRDLEEELEALRIAVRNLPPPQPPPEGEDGMGGGPHGEHSGRRMLDPKQWDGRRLRIELQRLAMRGRRMAASPLLEACAQAAAEQGDPAFDMLVQTLQEAGLPANVRLAATMVLERMGDERAVPPLLETLPTAAEPAQRRAIVRALANLPGDAQVPTLLAIWDDPEAETPLRTPALHALALRAHVRAIAVVAGTEEVPEPALRAVAIAGLHGHVREDGYRKTDLIPTFGAALATAAGDGQARVALLALEGFWRQECVPHLRALESAEDVSEELAKRARSVADAIESRAPRPEGAGQSQTGRPAPDEDE